MTSETIVKIVTIICTGVAATVTMDVLGLVSSKLGLTADAKGQWIGRLYLDLARSSFYHSNNAEYPEQPGEKTAAMVGHYVFGILLAGFYLVGADWLGISPGSLFIALGYGLATSVFTWFLVFPALGFGLFGIKASKRMKLLKTSLLNHIYYGFGLWWIIQLLPLT